MYSLCVMKCFLCHCFPLGLKHSLFSPYKYLDQSEAFSQYEAGLAYGSTSGQMHTEEDRTLRKCTAESFIEIS